MNPFVNPNKRDVSLPDGCKDLIDVLQRPQAQWSEIPDGIVKVLWQNIQSQFNDNKILTFIVFVLFQTQQDLATELIIGPAQPKGTPIKYKAGGIWQDMGPLSSDIRHDIISELTRLAKFPAGETVGEGVLDLTISKMQLKWNVVIASENGECKLTRIED
jgi:hypothetical protein